MAPNINAVDCVIPPSSSSLFWLVGDVALVIREDVGDTVLGIRAVTI